ncbi:MAG: hypothetical protein AB8C95_13080 [Phycisphaeraceae bacterium]
MKNIWPYAMPNLSAGLAVGSLMILVGCTSQPNPTDSGAADHNAEPSEAMTIDKYKEKLFGGKTAFHATIDPAYSGAMMLPMSQSHEVAAAANPKPSNVVGSPIMRLTQSPTKLDFTHQPMRGNVAYVSHAPMLTATDFPAVRIRPEGDRFVLEVEVSKAACNNLASAAGLNQSDDKPSLTYVQSLVLVRDGNVVASYAIENLITTGTLRIGAASQKEAEAIRSRLLDPKQ